MYLLYFKNIVVSIWLNPKWIHYLNQNITSMKNLFQNSLLWFWVHRTNCNIKLLELYIHYIIIWGFTDKIKILVQIRECFIIIIIIYPFTRNNHIWIEIPKYLHQLNPRSIFIDITENVKRPIFLHCWNSYQVWYSSLYNVLSIYI